MEFWKPERQAAAIALVIAAAFSSADAHAQLDPLVFDSLGAPYCTESSDLNEATRQGVQRQIRLVLRIPDFVARLERIGVQPVPDVDQLRPLDNARDSATCERIRRSIVDAPFRRIEDRERRRNVPDSVLMMFELPNGGYWAYVTHYNPGSADGGPAPPIMGHSSAYHFDANLNPVGSTEL